MNRVALLDSLRQAFQNHDTGAISRHRSGGQRIKWAAVPIRRVDPALFIKIASVPDDANRDPTSQCHFTFILQQAATCDMDRNQRSGTSGLNAYTRSTQIQFVGNLGGEMVLIVADSKLESICGLQNIRIAGKILPIAAYPHS